MILLTVGVPGPGAGVCFWGGLLRGVPGWGLCLLLGGPGLGRCLVETPPVWLLLRAVRILLECNLVFLLKGSIDLIKNDLGQNFGLIDKCHAVAFWNHKSCP